MSQNHLYGIRGKGENSFLGHLGELILRLITDSLLSQQMMYVLLKNVNII